jgi:H+/Cl- antiporter ClcA
MLYAASSDSTVCREGTPIHTEHSFTVLDEIEDQEGWKQCRPELNIARRQCQYKGVQSCSKFNREFYFPKNEADEFEKIFLSWLGVTFLSIAITIAGLLINIAVFAVYSAVYGISQMLILDRNDHMTPSVIAVTFVLFACTCACFATIACLLVLFVSPHAEGSGIPDVKSYLNGWHIDRLFSFPALIVKSVGCAFSVGSGLVAGRAGPIIHVGAILGAALSQGGSQTFQYRIPSDLVKHFRSAEWKRDFAVMGSAFGVAAAFVAPMGGVLFAIEEGASSWRQQLTFLSLYGALLTAFLTSIGLGLIEDPSRLPIVPFTVFGSYRNEASHLAFDVEDFPYILLIGVIGGLIGSFYSELLRYIIPLRKRMIRPSKLRTVLEVVLVSLAISVVRFWVPVAFGRCVSNEAFSETQVPRKLFNDAPSPAQFNCADREVNDLAIIFWVPMQSMLQYILHVEGFGAISVGTLCGCMAFSFVGAVMVFGTAMVSGLFVPFFVIGACFGRLVGMLAAYRLGNERYGLITTYALLGSASALGGMTRVTISVALIAMESTQNFSASLYCFAVVLIAKLVADSFNIGIYETVIELRKIPFLVDDLGHAGYQLSVKDCMTPVSLDHAHSPGVAMRGYGVESPRAQPLANIRSVETLHNVLHILRSNMENFEFIVNNESDNFIGTVERFVIIRLLEHRLLGENVKLLHPSTIDSAWPNLRHDSEGRKDREDKLVKQLIADGLVQGHDSTDEQYRNTYGFQPDQIQHRLVLDLRPYIDREPAVVLSSGSLRKAHDYLRAGEYSVLVARPESVQIVGVISRHDLMPAVMAATLQQKKRQLKTERKERRRMKLLVNLSSRDATSPTKRGHISPIATRSPTSRSHIRPISPTIHEDTEAPISSKDGTSTQESKASSEPVSRKRSDSKGIPLKQQVIVDLLPFEPRFYQLLWQYLVLPRSNTNPNESTAIDGTDQSPDAAPLPPPHAPPVLEFCGSASPDSPQLPRYSMIDKPDQYSSLGV